MYMKVKELGTFQEEEITGFNSIVLSPVAFDWSGRKLWLDRIQQLVYKEIGSSDHSYDQIGVYNFIFCINSGNNAKSYNPSEPHHFILQIEISEWYQPEDMLAKEIKDRLKEYPILYIQEVLDAFRQRHYYRNSIVINHV